MIVSDELKDFLQNPANQTLLKDCNFKELYERLDSYGDISCIGEFSALMLRAGIDPLKYLDEVPENFLCFQKGVTKVVIPDNIKKIGPCAFYGCTNLKDLFVPVSVTFIDRDIIEGCGNLRSIKYAGTQSQWYATYRSAEWLNWNRSLVALRRICCTDENIKLYGRR